MITCKIKPTSKQCNACMEMQRFSDAVAVCSACTRIINDATYLHVLPGGFLDEPKAAVIVNGLIKTVPLDCVFDVRVIE